MRILLIGGTGLIGGAVLRRLAPAHEVLALSRRAEGDATLAAAGATPVRGALADAADWAGDLPPLDALIQCAADFSAEDMGAAEAPLIAAIEAGALPLKPGAAALYTGGVWLYPAGDEVVSDEATGFEPLPAFAWMVDHWRRLRASPAVRGVCVHPGLVFDDAGRGAIDPLTAALTVGGPVPVCGDPDVRWPMVHADDLADLYARALEGGRAGECFNGVAANGVPVRRIVEALAADRGLPAPTLRPLTPEEARRRFGASADGFARSQRVSAGRARERLGWRARRPVPGASPTTEDMGDCRDAGD
ncbi:MAG: NAD-dependent epimerase/dehydratase family protein [Marivibrio sp.]|uniref:NAD-dependent epimerase/dehydratase family protein n=1 Tax=Marivibrio sp. TaxID=2039719 RepID=UPI0032ECDB75